MYNVCVTSGGLVETCDVCWDRHTRIGMLTLTTSCKLIVFVHSLQIFAIFGALSEGTDSQVTVQLQTVL